MAETVNEADKSNDVRKAAAESLGQIGDQRSVEPLLKVLHDKDANVSKAAIVALGKIGDRQAITALLMTLKDADIWKVAEVALAKIDASWARSNEAKKAFPSLVAMFNDKDASGRKYAGIVESVLTKIDANWTKSEEAKALVPSLMAALDHPDTRVRQTAVRVLEQIGDKWAVSSLLMTLKYPDTWEVAEIALAKIDPYWAKSEAAKTAVHSFIKALGNQDSKVRQAAAKILGKLGDRQAVEPLKEALWDRDSDVSCAAVMALRKIGDPSAVEPLVILLACSGGSRRQIVAEALGAMGDARAVVQLVEALEDTYEDVRKAAAEALGAIGDTRAIEPLVAALKGNYEEDVRRAIAEALGKIGGGQAANTLTAAIQNSGYADDDARMLEALALIGGDIQDIRPLTKALSREIPYLGAAAGEALLRVRSPHLQPLIDLASDKRFGGTVVQILENWLDSNAPNISEQSLRAITQLQGVCRVEFYHTSACEAGVHSRDVPVNTSHLKQLARQELIRRGLQA